MDKGFYDQFVVVAGDYWRRIFAMFYDDWRSIVALVGGPAACLEIVGVGDLINPPLKSETWGARACRNSNESLPIAHV
jgi:hypothetical protein